MSHNAEIERFLRECINSIEMKSLVALLSNHVISGMEFNLTELQFLPL